MPPQGPNEKQDEIIQLLRDRDERGLNELFEHYGPALNHQILQIVEDSKLAEEVLHDVLLKIWNGFESYDTQKSRLYTWMSRIARNAAIDKTRSKNFKQRRKTDGLDFSVLGADSGSVTPYTDHIGLDKIVDGLDAKYRAIIHLLYFRDYSQSECAQELDLPLGTVKTRARRAIQQLRELLRHELIVLLIVSLFCT